MFCLKIRAQSRFVGAPIYESLPDHFGTESHPCALSLKPTKGIPPPRKARKVGPAKALVVDKFPLFPLKGGFQNHLVAQDPHIRHPGWRLLPVRVVERIGKRRVGPSSESTPWRAFKGGALCDELNTAKLERDKLFGGVILFTHPN